MVSLGSKQLNPTEENLLFYDIQAWIGVALVLLWGIYLIIAKGKEKKAQIKAEQ